MAIVREDGTGKATAETYCSEAEAASYFTLTDTNDSARDALVAAWTSAGSATREGALREATVYLDGTYLERWVGAKKTAAQALAWPRTGAYDAYGFAIASTVIPARLKHATAEMALRAYSVSVLSDEAAGSGSLTARSVTAGSVSLSQSWGTAGARARARYARVEALLRPLLSSAGQGVVALARA